MEAVNCLPDHAVTWGHVVLALIASAQTVALAWLAGATRAQHREIARTLNGASSAGNT